MDRRLHCSATAPSTILPVATAALAIGIFVVDTFLTDLEIAVSVFFIVPVLMSVFLSSEAGRRARICRMHGIDGRKLFSDAWRRIDRGSCQRCH
jgi:hypothetical protein